MSAPKEVPGADWTSAGGFPLLRSLAKSNACQAPGERPAPARWRALRDLLRRAFSSVRPERDEVRDLAAADLARPVATRCSSCGVGYFPRPKGSRLAEDGRCRSCAQALAERPVVQLAARRRSR